MIADPIGGKHLGFWRKPRSRAKSVRRRLVRPRRTTAIVESSPMIMSEYFAATVQ